MKNWSIEALILAAGLSLAGLFIKNGLNDFSARNRVVTVKGLAEMEVPANKVTWPLTYKVLGNDMKALYNEIQTSNQKIVNFLKSKGIKDDEISINAPEIIDNQAERYNSNESPYRYNVTTVITVTSNQVDLVRKMINEQSELLTQGVAITAGDYRYNITYDYTGLNDIKPKMIEEATKNARAAAEKFAKDSDSRLGGIQRAALFKLRLPLYRTRRLKGRGEQAPRDEGAHRFARTRQSRCGKKHLPQHAQRQSRFRAGLAEGGRAHAVHRRLRGR